MAGYGQVKGEFKVASRIEAIVVKEFSFCHILITESY